MENATRAMTLTEFLLARIAEDEGQAQLARGWQTGSRHEGQPLDWSLHMDRWSPDRVLAECEAKRRIVERAAEVQQASDDAGHTGRLERVWTWNEALRILAAVYSDHPDYREEWPP